MYLNTLSKNIKDFYIPAVLNSYSIVFFLNNKVLAGVILLTTFFNFYAGLSGLLAVLLVIVIANMLGFDKLQLKNGLYSFNALLTGIGMGTFFEPGIVYFVLLAFASLITLILSVSLGGWLFKNSLPFLSLPFVLTFWFIVLPSSFYENLGLTQRNIFWINEVYSVGGNTLLNVWQTIDNLEINHLVDIYLRSLSSIFFQNSLFTGAIIAVALLYSSRIMFSLSVIGFASAFIFAQFSGTSAASITYYNIGANYMMVAFAIGGYFMIPSKYSYLWTVLLVPVTSILLLFLTKLTAYLQLPVFSLPFSIVTILFVFFLRQRASEKKLILTPYQTSVPETNLYLYLNNKERYKRFNFMPLHLPFWGEWTVWQGYNGIHTHKGDWGNALDFVITDETGSTFRSDGYKCEDYYCFGKPVLSPADGVVVEIIDNIDDNKIGDVNTTNNWGNSIVIRHTTGLYSQLSHLKKASVKVSKGSVVRKGDILAQCGNSGRSPQPHLHYQIQIYPNIGSRTIYYPIGYYFRKSNSGTEFSQFDIPAEGDKVSDINTVDALRNAFSILPNKTVVLSYKDENGNDKQEHWESYTDAYNYKYLYCRQTGSVAYYLYDNAMFYFTAFYGSKDCLLYYFYLSSYKVFFGRTSKPVTDSLPLSNIKHKVLFGWLNDFISPFVNKIDVAYKSQVSEKTGLINENEIVVDFSINLFTVTKKHDCGKGKIFVKGNTLSGFTFESKKVKINALCEVY